MEMPSIDGLRSLCTAVGFVTLNWAMLERQMDNCISLALDCGGKQFSKVRPISLARKIDLLKKCFGRLPKLKPYQAEILALIKRTEAASETRHTLVHGVIVGLEEQHLHIDRLETLDQYDYKVNRHALDITKMRETVHSIAVLAGDWGRFAHTLLQNYLKP